MIFNFVKMHGLGNDFIIPEINEADLTDLSELAKILCDRHTGIGADGILLVCNSDRENIRMRIFNSDGTEAEMCGNGIRCFAKYVYEKKIISDQKFTIETLAGKIIPELFIDDGIVTKVRVNMNTPKLIDDEESLINFNDDTISNISEKLHKKILINENIFHTSSLTLGVPHSILYVDEIVNSEIKILGSLIEKHESFPKGTNVNFVKVVNDHEIIMRTWERGAGQTLACGTGSCAAGVASFLDGKTVRKITVHLELGDLEIELIDNSVFMTGPAQQVFEGRISLNF